MKLGEETGLGRRRMEGERRAKRRIEGEEGVEGEQGGREEIGRREEMRGDGTVRVRKTEGEGEDWVERGERKDGKEE